MVFARAKRSRIGSDAARDAMAAILAEDRRLIISATNHFPSVLRSGTAQSVSVPMSKGRKHAEEICLDRLSGRFATSAFGNWEDSCGQERRPRLVFWSGAHALQPRVRGSTAACRAESGAGDE